MRSGRRWTPWALLAPALLLYTIFVAFPVVRTAAISFQVYRLESGGASDWAGLSNYLRLLHDSRALRALGISLAYTCMITPTVVVLAALCAISLERVGRLSRWLRPWILMPMAVAAPILAAVWFTIYEGNRGLLNWVLPLVGVATPPQWLGPGLALPSVAFAFAWGSIPLGILLFTVALDRIEQELYDAAAVDGAGPLQQIRHITLPGLLRMAGVLAVLVMVNAMRDFQYPYIITAGGPAGATRTFSYAIYRTAFVDAPLDLGYASAMSMLFAGGLLLVSILVLRFTRKAALQ